MANTYTLIASSTVGSGGASSIDFTSISSTYTDLVIKISARAISAGGGTNGVWDSIRVRFNNDSATNYAHKHLLTIDSAAPTSLSDSADTSLVSWTDYSSATANTFGNMEIYIPNYVSSNQKSITTDAVMENNGSAGIWSFEAGKWSGTAAINRITITLNSVNFAQYSTAYLYGVSNA